MTNPWLQLPKKPPFVLPCDIESISIFNSRKRKTPFEIIDTEIPSPYIGNPESPVVFLNLNPAYSQEESESPQIVQYQKIARMNLLHQFTDYSFYVLDPSLNGTPSGYCWFNQKFSPLMRATGMNAKDLSKKIFLVEFFPYRSKKFKWNGGVLPSQKYAISLVEKAIAREAVIVIMRSEKFWINAIPILKNYQKSYKLHSPQNVTISENNLGKKKFGAVIKRLCE